MRAFAIANSIPLLLALACGAPSTSDPAQGGSSDALTNGDGVSLDRVSRSGTDLVGAQLQGSLSDGTALRVRIDGATYGSARDADVLFYAVSYQASSGWARLCGSEPDGSPTLALALPGRWATGGSWIDDPAASTLSCGHSALARASSSAIGAGR